MSRQKRTVRFSSTSKDESAEKRPRLSGLDSDDEADSDADKVMDESQVELSPITTQQDARGTMDVFHGSQADVGVIEKLDLENFMCHHRFEVSFSPNVNFIVGQNGSGKSAIMTAIVVALGGKAVSTQRGSSLKTFIRSGCKQADIRLTLRNRGSDAYKPDLYGPSITVVRQLRSDGAGSYKLKSSRGHVVSQGKEELIRILDSFNIQVDNPVSMLNQDTSRNFLHSSNPSTKFKLFMKGTHLEQIASDYTRAAEQQQLLEEEIRRKKQMLPELEMKAKELEEEVRDIERLVNMEERVQQLSMELLWAAASLLEQSVRQFEEAVESEQPKLHQYEQKLQRAEDALKHSEEEVEKAKSDLTAAMSEVRDTKQRKSELMQHKRDIDKAVRENKGQVEALQREILEKKREKRAFEDKLTQVQEQSQRSVASDREAHQSQLGMYEKQLAQKRAKLDPANRDKENEENRITALKREGQEKHTLLEDLTHQKNECKEIIQRLRSSQGNSLRTYGQWMVDLVAMLRREQQSFNKPPKGPLGAYIRVRDQFWCRAVEVAIGRNNLQSFVVDNRRDEAVFNGVVRNVFLNYPNFKFRPSCITSKFEGVVYDVTRKRSQCEHPAIMDMLIVEDADVMNTLIELVSVECSVLIRDNALARQVMLSRPPNTKSAYTPEGDQVFPDGYYSNKKPPLGMLKASVQEGITEQQQRLESMNREMMEIQPEEKRIMDQLAKAKDKVKMINIYIRNTRSDMHQLEMLREKVRAQIEEEEDQISQEDVTSYESVIQECEEKLSELLQQKEAARESHKKKTEEASAHLQTIREFDTRAQEMLGNVQEMKDKLERVHRVQDKARGAATTYRERCSRCRDDIRRREEKLVEGKRAAEKAVEEASCNCSRIDTERQPRAIQAEIRKIEDSLHSEQSRRNNQEQVRQMYIEAMDKLKTTHEAIIAEKKSLRELKASLNTRLVGYKDLRRRIAERACLYFANFVRRRGYNGALHIDMEKKKLEIIVQIDRRAERTTATRNTRTLSGGERSFATVSFIMALWEAIENPFRCLDEFDVFMDLMNRRISMQLMLEGAQGQQNRQFIFFTPQDMSALGVSRMSEATTTKIFQLRPPDRQQQTLD